ncbi:MAG: NADH dehydrogenase (quinone) subunit D [Chloroflexi bacterium]|nr:NADH dehydrogenase (quinone) subunit D [Chloroflexota bacterium]
MSQNAARTETMVLNMGPHHPSTHGVLRLILELDGEVVVKATPDIGYLHTGIEKTAESLNYTGAISLWDRVDYLAPLSNNLGFVLAVEKLLDIANIPPRAQCLRVLLVELQRIASHLVWLGTQAIDIGAVSVFLYCFREREQIIDIFEMVSGARMMTSYIRVGGLAQDIPEGFEKKVRDFIRTFPKRIDEYETLLTQNQIWRDRTVGIGKLSAEEAIDLGVTGPILRGSGLNWDIRKSHPYSSYEQFEFEVPLGQNGDVYDRYLCRIREMRESLKIVEQALNRLPKGPVIIDDRKIVPPPREELATSMEAVIHHFKIYTEGFKPPVGEVYVSIEGPRGELGFFVVSDGSAQPYRVRVRPPSFINLQALPRMLQGRLLADVVACIASIDIVLGEVDR